MHNKCVCKDVCDTVTVVFHAYCVIVFCHKDAPVNVKVAHKPSVREGDTVQLRCSSDANPAAHSYQWHSDSGELLARGHLYMLPNVSRHIGALYCTAINTKGQANSSSVQLNVQCKSSKLELMLYRY